MSRVPLSSTTRETTFFALAMVVACTPRPHGETTTPASATQASAAWHVDATLRDGAAGIDVRLCFDDVVPKRLRTLSDTPAAVFGTVTADDGRTLGFDGDRVALQGVVPGTCVSYGVDLRLAAERLGGRAISWVGDSVLVRQSMWLLWPEGFAADRRADLVLHLPEGVAASVPWPVAEGTRGADGSRYWLDSTISRWLGYTAFGELEIDRIERAQSEIEITRLDGALAADAVGVRTWIEDAVDGAAMLYGKYPRDRLQVVVVPVDGGRSGGVYFGAAARGGGSGVYLLVESQAPAERLAGGWTTVHELLHHGMPFVSDAWMSEGFVSYYTEVIRTRQGHRDEATGWYELRDAFARGGRSGRGASLRETSDAMHESHAYQRVYWGGAAIAFDLDVTLRIDTQGRLGLDDAMKELRRCCGEALFQFSAAALLERLDRWYGKPLFTETARRHLDAATFVDTDAIMARIGVVPGEGTVTIAPSHPHAAVRAAIMAPRTPGR
jgi:hypothetical protein